MSQRNRCYFTNSTKKANKIKNLIVVERSDKWVSKNLWSSKSSLITRQTLQLTRERMKIKNRNERKRENKNKNYYIFFWAKIVTEVHLTLAIIGCILLFKTAQSVFTWILRNISWCWVSVLVLNTFFSSSHFFLVWIGVSNTNEKNDKYIRKNRIKFAEIMYLLLLLCRASLFMKEEGVRDRQFKGKWDKKCEMRI